MTRVPGTHVPFIKPSKIDNIAAWARRELAPKVAADEKVDMLRVLDEVDGRRVGLPNGVNATVRLAVEDLPPHVLGETRLFEDEIFLAMNSSTYNMLRDEGWARFTAAHEVGHVKMHPAALAQLRSLSQYEVALARETATINHHVDSEYQANIFAATFLAPDEGLRLLNQRGHLQIDTVMKTFGMGRKAATARVDSFLRRGGRRSRRHLGGR